MATELITQKGKVRLERVDGGYDVVAPDEASHHTTLLGAWCAYLSATGWTDAEPPDTSRKR